MIWGPVLAEPPLATLHEMRTSYSLKDAVQMADMLDFKAAVLEAEQKRAEEERKRKEG